MSKKLIFVALLAIGFTLFFSSCGDDEEEPTSIDIPLAFLRPMAAGDYTVKITITAPDLSSAILSEQNLAIVEGANRTYDVTVDNIPVGNQRTVKVEVFKAGKLLFVGSGTVNISSGANQLALRLEKVPELLSSEPQAGAQLLNTESLTLNFSAPPGTVTVNGKHAAVQGQTAIWSAAGMAAGKTNLNIAWTAAGGGSDTLQVIIIGSPATIALTPASAKLTALGETVQLNAEVKDSKNQPVPGATVSWRSSNSTVANVNASGVVTAREGGTVTITATSGGKSASVTITVSQSASIVVIAPTSTTLTAVGATTQLQATVWDTKGNTVSNATVSWRSSNTAVATVSSSGRFTARSNGTVTITATSGGRSATVRITVSQSANTVAITPTSTTLAAIGATTQLRATVRDTNNYLITGATVSWGSSNTAVAAISPSGLVTARGDGTATITATSGGKSASATITVSQSTSTVVITPTSANLTAIGSTTQLRATVRDTNNNTVSNATVSWTSSNTAVAAISPSGLVTARGDGTATITATSGGKSASATITVSQSTSTVVITPTSANLTAIGATTQLQATVRDTNNNTVSNATVSWRSSNTAVASVSSSGRVTARGNGTVTITATSGGRSATAQITVSQSASTVAITPTSTTLTAVGAATQLQATVRDPNNNTVSGATVSWRSSNTAVATVSSSGRVTARGNGTATITATSGGRSATARITVSQSASAVAISPTSVNLTTVGETVQLQATVRDTNGNTVPGATVSWRSSNTAVATVNASGIVTARGNGTATITATSGGKSVSMTITAQLTPALANMVSIPAGTFQMGSDDSDAQADEEPVHTVYVDAFYMDIYEVTNAEYKKFVDANPEWSKSRISRSYHTGGYLDHWTGNSYPSGKGNHPVTHVSWFAAMAYAQWTGKRLPTEAEWEKAARGGLVGKKYPWGDSIDAGRANYGRNAGDTTPVGSYSRNGYGLYDMAGNVSEWCLDGYQENFYANSPYRNPIAGGTITSTTNNFANVTTKRVLRGGSWFENPKFVRVPSRPWSPPTFAYDGYGFRCAWSE